MTPRVAGRATARGEAYGRRPVLFDTDIGSDVDDALALGADPRRARGARARRRHHRGGDARAARAHRRAACSGSPGARDVEVCAGEERPLLRARGALRWFGPRGALPRDGPRAPLSAEPAPERIVRAAREIPGLELVAVGPLTNLARALALDPELPQPRGRPHA